jgi:GNAT superfamily N-acetyltransferase
MEVWEAAAGAEERVRAAEAVFDHAVDLQATRRFLRHEGNHLLIAYVEGEPAGFASATELEHPDHARPELFLNELGVVPAYRGRGIARALVAALWELARRLGCRGMWVLTDEKNASAMRVYATAGGVRRADPVMFQWGET